MQLQYIISLIWFESFGLGAIQQLRGQEEGEGGQSKVHACPPRGGGPLNVHVDQNLKK